MLKTLRKLPSSTCPTSPFQPSCAVLSPPPKLLDSYFSTRGTSDLTRPFLSSFLLFPLPKGKDRQETDRQTDSERQDAQSSDMKLNSHRLLGFPNQWASATLHHGLARPTCVTLSSSPQAVRTDQREREEEKKKRVEQSTRTDGPFVTHSVLHSKVKSSKDFPPSRTDYTLPFARVLKLPLGGIWPSRVLARKRGSFCQRRPAWVSALCSAWRPSLD